MKRYWLILSILILLLGDHAAVCTADPADLAKTMQESTVMVVILTPKGQMVGHGSGFITGEGDYVITNDHVAFPVIQGKRYQLPLVVIVGGQTVIRATAVWTSERRDVSILKLEKNAGAERSVTFATNDTVKINDDIILYGFPAETYKFKQTDAAYPLASPAKGIVAGNVQNEGEVKMWQLSANVNHGNSGGPLFNSKGQVIGIVESRLEGNTNQSVVLGIGYAIQIDEDVLRDIKLQGVKANLAKDQPQQPPFEQPAQTGETPAAGTPVAEAPPLDDKGDQYKIIIIVGMSVLALLLMIIGIFVWKRTKKVAVPAGAPAGMSAGAPAGVPAGGASEFRQMENQPAVRPVVNAAPARPAEEVRNQPVVRPIVSGVSGTFTGRSFTLQGNALIIGRDSMRATILYPADTSCISRVHCTLTFQPQGAYFILKEDAASPSRNGTFLINGERLVPGREYRLFSGDQFYVAIESERFMVQVIG